MNVFVLFSEKKPPLPNIPCLMEQLPEVDWMRPQIMKLHNSQILVKRAQNCIKDAACKRGGKRRRTVCSNRDWKLFQSIDYSHKFKQL